MTTTLIKKTLAFLEFKFFLIRLFLQVDSPCSSPVSLTPACSSSNLAVTPAATTCATTPTASPTTVTPKSPPHQQLKKLPDGSVQIPIRIEGVALGTMSATADDSSEQPMEVEGDDNDAGQQHQLASPSTAVEEPVSGEVVVPLVPAPKHITEVEYKVLSSCLTRYVIVL